MAEEKKGFFKRLVSGLAKTRDNIVAGFDNIFSGFSSIDEDFYEELEEILIMGDIGINATTSIIENLKKEVSERHIKEPMECKQLLINEIKDQMRVDSTEYEFENRRSVVLVIGVNGVGKTTSVGKLAGKLKDQGKKVILAAADTFRAAAGEQLTEWANRAGVEIIGGQAGADPASVIYDAVAAAKARNADVLLCDTAGRLHNKKNLMEELRKIYRILEREYPDAYLETLVVLDGTTGQNALAQARQFAEVANVSGIILTKLDGTAKGGIAVAIQSELDIPVKYIGVGESIDDLQKFDKIAHVYSPIFSICQSIGSTPLAFKNSLHWLKCLQPKKPLYADNGLGCGALRIRCFGLLSIDAFLCAGEPHSIYTIGLSCILTALITASVNCSQPCP